VIKEGIGVVQTTGLGLGVADTCLFPVFVLAFALIVGTV